MTTLVASPIAKYFSQGGIEPKCDGEEFRSITIVLVMAQLWLLIKVQEAKGQYYITSVFLVQGRKYLCDRNFLIRDSCNY